jgi:hypothetical protein
MTRNRAEVVAYGIVAIYIAAAGAYALVQEQLNRLGAMGLHRFGQPILYLVPVFTLGAAIHVALRLLKRERLQMSELLRAALMNSVPFVLLIAPACWFVDWVTGNWNGNLSWLWVVIVYNALLAPAVTAFDALVLTAVGVAWSVRRRREAGTRTVDAAQERP